MRGGSKLTAKEMRRVLKEFLKICPDLYKMYIRTVLHAYMKQLILRNCNLIYREGHSDQDVQQKIPASESEEDDDEVTSQVSSL